MPDLSEIIRDSLGFQPMWVIPAKGCDIRLYPQGSSGTSRNTKTKKSKSQRIVIEKAFDIHATDPA